MGVTLFKNCKFLFGGADPESVSTGLSVAVEDDRILFLGTEKEYYEQHPEKSLFTVIDCTDKLVMPGLVDGHNHLCNTLMNISRAFPFDYSHISDHMLTTIHDPYGWLTPESLYDITMTSAINALKHGTTTVENSTILPDTAYEAMDTSGIRGILAPQMASSFRLDSDPLNWKQALEKTKSCIEHYHNPKRRMSVAVHIHDLWDCMEKLMDGALELAEQYDTRFVTHFWEFQNAVERADEMWRDDGGAFSHYMKRGLITSRSVLFHGSMLREPEIEAIAGTGASIIHNPDINGTNCGNCAYVPYMLKNGINVGLGSDYGSLDTMSAMKLMLIVHNIMPRAERVLPYQAPFYAATMGSARAYGLDQEIGSIEPGKKADIITIDLKKAPHLLPLCTSLLEASPELLYFLFTRNCAGTTTSETMVDGKLLRRDGEFLNLDEEKFVKKTFDWTERCMTDLMEKHRFGEHYARIIHPDFMKDGDITWDVLN